MLILLCHIFLNQILNQPMFNLFYIYLALNCCIFQLEELILYLVELKIYVSRICNKLLGGSLKP
jgi:hypothetical protein